MCRWRVVRGTAHAACLCQLACLVSYFVVLDEAVIVVRCVGRGCKPTLAWTLLSPFPSPFRVVGGCWVSVNLAWGGFWCLVCGVCWFVSELLRMTVFLVGIPSDLRSVPCAKESVVNRMRTEAEISDLQDFEIVHFTFNSSSVCLLSTVQSRLSPCNGSRGVGGVGRVACIEDQFRGPPTRQGTAESVRESSREERRQPRIEVVSHRLM
jgi:hypothetical protein